jgi:hypothetical protein
MFTSPPQSSPPGGSAVLDGAQRLIHHSVVDACDVADLGQAHAAAMSLGGVLV